MKRLLTALTAGACLALAGCSVGLEDSAAPVAQETSSPTVSPSAQPEDPASAGPVDSVAVLLPEPFAVAVPAVLSTQLTPIEGKNGRAWYAVLRTPPGQGAYVVGLLAAHAEKFGFEMSSTSGRAWGRHVPEGAVPSPTATPTPTPTAKPTPTPTASARPSGRPGSPSSTPAPFVAPFRGDVKRTPATPVTPADAWVDVSLMVVQAGQGVPGAGGDYVTVAFGTTNP